MRVPASTHAYLQAYACTHGRVQARVGGARQALRLALLVEDGVWPEYTLHEAGTWMAHRKELGRRTHAPVCGRGD